MIKLGLITDLHYAPEATEDNNDWSQDGSPVEYRRYSTAETRLSQAVSTFNSESVDIVAQLGDAVDSSGGRTELQAFITDAGDLTMDLLNVTGNHEISAIDTVADYYTDISGKQATMANVATDVNGWKSYTYDVDDTRFVVIHVPSVGVGGGAVNSTHTDWLNTQLNATDMPVVILSHGPLFEISDYSWSYPSNHETVRGIIDTYKNVQVCLSGHWHFNHKNAIYNDIWYRSFWGSILAPSPSDNAYYIIEIEPSTVWTPNGYKANVSITGYGSKGLSGTKPSDSFAIC